jgi:hypothetical protein
MLTVKVGAVMNSDVILNLVDVHEICRIKGLYVDTIDRIVRDRQPDDIEKLGNLFADDSIIDFTQLGIGVIDGKKAIVELFSETMPTATAWMWHKIGSPVIDVNVDHAVGRWTLYALSTLVSDPTARPSATYGRYVDEFRRTAEGWKCVKIFFLNETK